MRLADQSGFLKRETYSSGNKHAARSYCDWKGRENGSACKNALQGADRQGQMGWNCVSGMKEVLQVLNADGKALGTSVTGWQAVWDGAMWYIQKKKAEHCFDGKGKLHHEVCSDIRLAGS